MNIFDNSKIISFFVDGDQQRSLRILQGLLESWRTEEEIVQVFRHLDWKSHPDVTFLLKNMNKYITKERTFFKMFNYCERNGWTAEPLFVPAEQVDKDIADAMWEELTSTEVYAQTLKTPIKATEFDAWNYVSDYHDQDCCENVYIDMDAYKSCQPMVDELWEITRISIDSAPKDGFIFRVYNKDWQSYGIFFACYNKQNWYYSDNLDLILNIEWVETTINLNSLSCVKDEIY